MNVAKIIAECRAELAAVNEAISRLEQLRDLPAKPISRRGRKSMSAEERLEVSARMTRYWDGVRQARQCRS